MNATELAQRLGVSKARVSQYVSSGVLAGCFDGEGRSRRFDLAKVQQALHGGLDKGQMLGNGAATRQALRRISAETLPDAPPLRAAAPTDGVLPLRDPDRYELARIQNAEEDARRKRRDNQRDEGRWVLVDEAERSTAALLARELGQFDLVLREGARAVADKLGVDFREVRQILTQHWREHRSQRTEELLAEADASSMTDAEQEADC